jgi:hypothetical protein
VASAPTIQALCQAARGKKCNYLSGLYRLPEILAERIRIQNLRFAYFLCAAQRMSGVIKR